MDSQPPPALAAVIDRLAADFPSRDRAEIVRLVGRAWRLFGGTTRDDTGRLRVTEWFVRTELLTTH